MMIRQVNWLVIPEVPCGIQGISVDRMQALTRQTQKYKPQMVYLHGLNLCDFVFLPRYEKFNRLLNVLRRGEIEQNIAHLHRLVDILKSAGLRVVLSCSMPALPHAYLPGCHNFLNPFVSSYPEVLNAEGSCFREVIHDQVSELFQNAPGLDGLDCYLWESNFPISTLSGGGSHEDRLVTLFTLLAEGCRLAAKSFSVMCFAHTSYENEMVRGALKRLPKSLGLRVRHFPNRCDYHPCMPMNENIGQVGEHAESLEIDCTGEYWGQAQIPCCYPDYIQERCQAAIDASANLNELVCRVNWEWGYLFDTPNEANLGAVHQWAGNPALSGSELLDIWAMSKYGKKATPCLSRALVRTFEAAAKLFYLQGFWVSDHSELPSLEYAYDHLLGYGVERAERIPQTQSLLLELLHPTQDTVAAVRAEKQDAVNLYRRSRDDLEQARMHLTEEAYLGLRRSFELALNCARVWGLFSEMLVRRQMFINGDWEQRDILQKQSGELMALADATQERFGPSVHPGNPGAIRTFARDIATATSNVTFKEEP